MTRQFDPQFFMREDVPVEGPPRELVGYGEHPPKVRWEDDARVAVQIVVNYEEGSEKTFAMGDGDERRLYELPVRASRASATWRSSRTTSTARAPASGGCSASSTPPASRSRYFAAAVALERNPEVAAKLARARRRGRRPRLSAGRTTSR